MNFKGKKHLIRTFFVKWNYLTQISTVLVAQIGVNDFFLSLPLKSDDLSLSSLNQGLKK